MSARSEYEEAKPGPRSSIIDSRVSSQRRTGSSGSPEVFTGLVADIDTARNLFRVHEFAEAESVLTRVISIVDGLLGSTPRLRQSDVHQLSVLCACALVLLGRTYEEQGSDVDAKTYYQRAAKLFDEHASSTQLSPDAQGYRGVALRVLGRREEAIASLQSAILDGAAVPELYRHLGWALKDEHRYGEAESHLKKALELLPSDSVSRRLLAETLEALGQSEEAAAAYCEAALLLSRSGAFEQALGLANQAIRVFPNDGRPYAYLGEILRALNRNAEALTALEKSLALNPEDEWALAGQGAVLDALGRPLEALQFLDRAIAKAPHYAWALGVKGAVLLRLEREEEAVPILKEALQADPSSWSAGYDLSRALIKLGQYPEALSVIELALEQFPDDPVFFALQGDALSYLDRFEDALQSFNRAVTHAQDYSYGWSRKGEIHLALGHKEEALEALDRALEIDPKYSWTSVVKASVLADLGRRSEAVVLLQQAVEEGPKSSWFLAQLASAWENLDNLDRSLSTADRALELDPQSYVALVTKGDVLRRLGKYDQALEYVEKALVLNPTLSYPLGTKGQILRGLGRSEEAIAAFRAALARDPEELWILKDLSDILEDCGQTDEARITRERILTVEYEDALALAFKGYALYRLGQCEKARELLERAVKAAPTEAFSRTTLGEVLQSLGDYAAALEQLDHAISINPMDDRAHALKGQVLHDMQRNNEAVVALEAAVAVNDRSGLVFAELADTYHDLEQQDQALLAVDRALELNPQYLFALETKGKILCDIQEYDAALDTLDRALRIQVSASLYSVKGWALDYSDRIDEARQAWSLAHERDPQDAWNRSGLAVALDLLGFAEEARKQHEWIIENFASHELDARTLSLIGWCHYGCGRFEDGVRFYTEALSFDNNLVASQFDLALILAASKRFSLSKSEYERGIKLNRDFQSIRRRAFLNVAIIDLRRAIQKWLGGGQQFPRVLDILQTLEVEFRTANAEATPILEKIGLRSVGERRTGSDEVIVAEATKSRSDLAELDHKIQEEIDEIVLAAARAGRPLSADDENRRKVLRADQLEVQEAFEVLAFATLGRLDKSADVEVLKGKLDSINANLIDDLDRLKNVARYAEIAAKVADGLTQLAIKVAGAVG